MIVWDPGNAIDVGRVVVNGGGCLERFYCIRQQILTDCTLAAGLAKFAPIIKRNHTLLSLLGAFLGTDSGRELIIPVCRF